MTTLNGSSSAIRGGASAAPLVTVITPTFNHERFIGDCIRSVLAQSEPRWEQIVVDDGSTDATREIVASFADPRVRWIGLPHRGIDQLAETYNTALKDARGEFVAVLEGDDFWPPDKLERQLPAFSAPDTVMSWGRALETYPDGQRGREIPDDGLLARAATWDRGEAIRTLLRGNPIPACTVICRHTALDQLGGFLQPDGVPNVDYATWLALLRLGAAPAIPATLGFWRRHPAQVTSRLSAQMRRNIAWATTFVEQLPPDERARLGVSVEEARSIQRRQMGALAFRDAVAASADGSRDDALRYLRQAVRMGGPTTRARALAGILALAARIDMGRLLGIRKRVRALRRRAP